MLTKIDTTLKYGRQQGGFGLQILYPGLIRPSLKDSGFFTIGRIDHARITPGTLIPMHPHKDDEILTYLRSGQVKHLDSEGFTGIVSNQQWMLMNAGGSFYHQEKVLEEGGVLEGLQIFVRPEVAGQPPLVQFHPVPEVYSHHGWRKVAGKGQGCPLQIRSHTWIMDRRAENGEQMLLPEVPFENVAFLLYVFSGEIEVNGNMLLTTGESVLIEEEYPVFTALQTSDVVLLITQTDALHFDGGMYSGNLQE